MFYRYNTLFIPLSEVHQVMEESQKESRSELIKSRFRQKLIHRVYLLFSNEYTFFILIAILIGFLSGLANFAFIESYQFIYSKAVMPLWGSPFVIISTIGGGLILLLLSFIFPPSDVLGYGFPKFLERINLKGGVLKPKETIAKAVASCVTLGFGGSAGQEGPIAQIGGTVGSFVGQILKISRNKIRVFIACGVAAGIAATFNAPIAGVLFAEEIALLRDFKIESFVPIVISSAIGTVTSRALRGDTPVFTVPLYRLVSYKELFFYAALGLVTGLLASGFIKVFYWTKDTFIRLELSARVKPILGGYIVGLIGILLPHILGNGYEHVEKALLGELSLWTVVGLILLKPIATSITLGSGWPGGMFAPSIFIGAMLGSAFGKVVGITSPATVGLSSAYATVGMGAFLAAVTQAPLTSIFLIFEMTQTYQVVVPIMISSVLGSMIVQILVGGSLESVEFKRMGIDIEEKLEAGDLGLIRVEDIMTHDIETIPENMTLRKLIGYIPKSHYTTFPVVDEKGFLTGIISIQDLREWIFEESLEDLIVVKEVATLNVITVTPEETLDTVLRRWTKKTVEILPVVESTNSKKIVGLLSRRDLIAAYNRAVFERRLKERG
jgi:CIC family chloride channel protein